VTQFPKTLRQDALHFQHGSGSNADFRDEFGSGNVSGRFFLIFFAADSSRYKYFDAKNFFFRRNTLFRSSTSLSVQSLTQAIERQYAIPASSQVLLVSGGETLIPSYRVCTYSAGTDTNPIFMFSSDLEQRNAPAPWPSIENGKQKAKTVST
jgi:hypothetical protein